MNQAPAMITMNLLRLAFKYNHGDAPSPQILTAILDNQNFLISLDNEGKAEINFSEQDLNKIFSIDVFEMIDIQSGYPCHKLSFTVKEWLNFQSTLSSLSSPSTPSLPITIIPSPIIIELHKEYGLKPHQIEYFKKNKNRAHLFIHGFNSALGDYGHYPIHYQIKRDFSLTEPQYKDAYEKVERHYIEFKPSPYKRTLRYNLCEPREILATFNDLMPQKERFFKRYQPIINPEGQGEEESFLNGTEAHHWFNAMEYNFNVACGFDTNNYQTYQRMIGIHWPGDVGILHFSKAEEIANEQAFALSKLILQLADHGIEINIVSHSLGCRVLLRCMEWLANNKYENVITHSTFWQAAMPNIALSQHPKIFSAAQKMTVLFSRKDGILQSLYCGNQLPKYPINALGFSGPKDDIFINEMQKVGKLILVDQSHILNGHSYMKIPTQELMNAIYKKFIFS